MCQRTRGQRCVIVLVEMDAKKAFCVRECLLTVVVVVLVRLSHDHVVFCACSPLLLLLLFCGGGGRNWVLYRQERGKLVNLKVRARDEKFTCRHGKFVLAERDYTGIRSVIMLASDMCIASVLCTLNHMLPVLCRSCCAQVLQGNSEFFHCSWHVFKVKRRDRPFGMLLSCHHGLVIGLVSTNRRRRRRRHCRRPRRL